MTTTSNLEIAIKQLQFSREYMLSLIADLDDADWFKMPAGVATHVGWQVGHLAMAQYGLCLFRQRGRGPNDSDLMSSTFRKQFSRGSKPEADVSKNPSAQEIRDVFNRVNAQSQIELPQLTETTLNEVVDMPYAVFPTKLGALFFCAQHEMLHAGQIGLLRRLLGKEPIR